MPPEKYIFVFEKKNSSENNLSAEEARVEKTVLSTKLATQSGSKKLDAILENNLQSQYLADIIPGDMMEPTNDETTGLIEEDQYGPKFRAV